MASDMELHIKYCKYIEVAREFVFNTKRIIYHTGCGFSYKTEIDIEGEPCPYCDKIIKATGGK
jgi:hypothetical protein